MKDVQTDLSEEECAGGMEQIAIFRCSPGVAVKDAVAKPGQEECALGMELCSNEGLTKQTWNIDLLDLNR